MWHTITAMTSDALPLAPLVAHLLRFATATATPPPPPPWDTTSSRNTRDAAPKRDTTSTDFGDRRYAVAPPALRLLCAALDDFLTNALSSVANTAASNARSSPHLPDLLPLLIATAPSLLALSSSRDAFNAYARSLPVSLHTAQFPATTTSTATASPQLTGTHHDTHLHKQPPSHAHPVSNPLHACVPLPPHVPTFCPPFPPEHSFRNSSIVKTSPNSFRALQALHSRQVETSLANLLNIHISVSDIDAYALSSSSSTQQPSHAPSTTSTAPTTTSTPFHPLQHTIPKSSQLLSIVNFERATMYK